MLAAFSSKQNKERDIYSRKKILRIPISKSNHTNMQTQYAATLANTDRSDLTISNIYCKPSSHQFKPKTALINYDNPGQGTETTQ